MRQAVCQRPVVREQEGAGRVAVESPDRDDALRKVDEVDDGSPPLRVARRRDRPGRLVEEDVGETLGDDLGAVDLDPVATLHERVQRSGLAVDAYASGLDQIVRAAP